MAIIKYIIKHDDFKCHLFISWCVMNVFELLVTVKLFWTISETTVEIILCCTHWLFFNNEVGIVFGFGFDDI